MTMKVGTVRAAITIFIAAVTGMMLMMTRPHCVRLFPDGSVERPGTVVLIHGLGRHWTSMLPMGWRLRRAGYVVCLYDYPSSRHGVRKHGAELATFLKNGVWKENDNPVHYVTHSLGGIILRDALGRCDAVPDGRIVMLAPPNQGSACASWWARLWFPSKLLKPLPDIRNDHPGTMVHQLPLPPLPTGVIIGDKDGKVTVEESLLPGNAETDHLVVPAFHTFLMNRRDVQEATERFLKRGCFSE